MIHTDKHGLINKLNGAAMSLRSRGYLMYNGVANIWVRQDGLLAVRSRGFGLRAHRTYHTAEGRYVFAYITIKRGPSLFQDTGIWQ